MSDVRARAASPARTAEPGTPRLLGLLALVVLVPAVALIVRHGFAGLYGQDAYAYTAYALGPLRDALLAASFPPPFAWPPGFPLLGAGLSLVLGPVDEAVRLVSLVAGSLVPVLVALLAWELGAGWWTAPRERAAVAVLAGAAVALCGHLWQSSVVAMADTSGAAAATAGALGACRYAATGRRRWLVLGAAALALAVEIRWVYGLVALAVGAGAMLAAGSRRGAGERADSHRTAARDLLPAAVVGAVVLLPTALPMLAAALRGAPIPFAINFSVYEWDVANVARRTFETADGRLEYALPSGLFYLLQPFQPYWFWPLGLLAVGGLRPVLRRPAVMPLMVLLGWPALVILCLAGGAHQNTRFFLAAAPPIAILVAFGAAEVWRSMGRARDERRRRIVRRVFATAIALGLVANGLAAIRFTDSFLTRQGRDRAAIRTLETAVPGDARLLSVGATLALRHDGRTDVAELFDLDVDGVRDLAADDRATYLLVDLDAIRGQWREGGPGRTVAALEANPGLEVIAGAGDWTLLRLGTRP